MPRRTQGGESTPSISGLLNMSTFERGGEACINLQTRTLHANEENQTTRKGTSPYVDRTLTNLVLWCFVSNPHRRPPYPKILSCVTRSAADEFPERPTKDGQDPFVFSCLDRDGRADQPPSSPCPFLVRPSRCRAPRALLCFMSWKPRVRGRVLGEKNNIEVLERWISSNIGGHLALP